MANTHSSLSALFTDIADAIRELTGETGTIVADEFPDYIRGNLVVVTDWSNILQDFTYTRNADGTATITGWKQTLNGVPSTECVIPDNPKIIL